ncbi:MAG: AAA family ATPase [Butyrivibrio sp.]|nr:AAA family ATPase [Butyrivibrio sp.]
MSEIPFYEKDYMPQVRSPSKESTLSTILDNPVKIYDYLLSKIYKQDNYCRTASMILYNHIRGIRSVDVICGPPGVGKSHLWNTLKEIYPKIQIIDSSVLSQQGWSGKAKITDFLELIDPSAPEQIVVFDEFDKCIASQIGSGGTDHGIRIQAEFLKLLEGSVITDKSENNFIRYYDTNKMTFILCGSFAEKAAEIASKQSSSGLGFGAESSTEVPYSRELTMQDLIDFGLIPEIASRCTRIINLNSLALDDYIYLLTLHPASPIRKLEQLYGMPIHLSQKRVKKIAYEAYHSGLGIRNAYAQIQQIADERIMRTFMNQKRILSKNHKERKKTYENNRKSY